ncbi:MAG: ABC transporter permease [Oscillospiraceae bacterium]|nr:ABC transporter permease [Oscillospiraceae bacterium]
MSTWKKIRTNPLFLPFVSMILVMLVNVIYDTINGVHPLSFFLITLRNTTGNGTVLYGRIIDILNRGSEAAMLALGMTLVVSSSAGTDISVGSVMSLCASFCCMLLAGYGVSSTKELAMPLAAAVFAALCLGCLCGAFNGFLVAKLHIQPMVATLILFSAARAIGLLLCNDLIVYIRNDAFGFFGGFLGIIPTPIVITAICVVVLMIVLKRTALGMYIQSVGINAKASRIAGLNSALIIWATYILCGLFAAIAGIVAASRITSADSNNIGLYMELDAILAVALGGNSLGGGKFNLVGSIIGAYTIQAITTTLYNLGVSSAQAPVFKAVIVVLIVVIQAPPFKALMAKRSAARNARKGVARA